MKNKLIRIGVLSAWLVGAFCSVSAVKETNYIYLLAGGANALGAVRDGALTKEQISNYKSFSYLWNGNMDNKGAPNWSVVAPQHPVQKEPEEEGKPPVLSMGPEYGFCNMMQRRKWHSAPGEYVRVIKGAIDDPSGNECWERDGKAYNSFIRSMAAAAGSNDLKGRSVIRAFLWLNGEEEKGDRIPSVVQRFQDMLSRMDKDMRNGEPPLKAGEEPPKEAGTGKKVVPKVLKKGMPKLVIVGENAAPQAGDIDEDGKTVVKLMHNFVQKKKKTMGWVRTRDLERIGNSKKYNGRSQLAIGARFAYATAILEGLSIPFSRNDVVGAALNTPAAWWAGKMPQPDSVALWDISSANNAKKKAETAETKQKKETTETISADWAVGGIEVEDPFAENVVIEPKDAAAPAKIQLGSSGIRVKNADLTLKVPVEATTNQTWEIKSGRVICLGDKDKPVQLSGNACISLQAMSNASLELHLTALPTVTWSLPPQPIKTDITVGGKPAKMVKQDDGSYTIILSEAAAKK